ncbi:MAG: TetR/AcrR family transcriptional regulator [Oscillospiraceae bacterium]|nr:TetR/AcrR family transcriptional regulator [Oscillospiraceae bacterium]
MSELSETKEKIFDTFVEMASTLGYENVTTRDIAKKIGINAASIYHHFKSKEKILEFAYEYYSIYQYDNRKSVDEMKKIVETASAEGIINAFFYSFLSEDQRKYVRMVLITKIIYMRLFQDPLANSVFTSGNASNSEYVVSIFKHGIDVGRIDSSFDMETFADVIIGAITMMGIKAFSGAEYEVGQLEQEERIRALLARLLSTALT